MQKPDNISNISIYIYFCPYNGNPKEKKKPSIKFPFFQNLTDLQNGTLHYSRVLP